MLVTWSIDFILVEELIQIFNNDNKLEGNITKQLNNLKGNKHDYEYMIIFFLKRHWSNILEPLEAIHKENKNKYGIAGRRRP